jgi:1-acyl-sn-glycerol-3-phosphate acyltransferase
MRPNLPPHQGFIGGWAHLRAAVRGGALVVVTACLSVVQLCALRLSAPLTQYVPQLWHRASCRLLGMDVRAYGIPAVAGPVLYVCNHASYLDVNVLGGLVDARFVAKAEVAQWPIVGALSRLTRTIFIERRARGVRSQSDELRRVLRSGASLVLFPEGTSSDGNRVLPFKSALFAAADATAATGGEVKVQPVTIAYSRHRGLPMGRRLRPYFAWYGDMTLVGHLWECLGIGGAGIDVVFHDPVRLSQFASRKALAQHCHAQIAHGLSDALAGRMVYRPPVEQRPMAGQLLLPIWPNSAVLETGRKM